MVIEDFISRIQNILYDLNKFYFLLTRFKLFKMIFRDLYINIQFDSKKMI